MRSSLGDIQGRSFSRLLGVALLMLSVTVATAAPKGAPGSEEATDTCRGSRVTFDCASFLRIYGDPDQVLADVEAFWMEDRAYWLLTQWYGKVGDSIPPGDWQISMKGVAAMNAEQRRGLPLWDWVRQVEEAGEGFHQQVLPLICSLLPGERTDLSTTVYFTGAARPTAIETHGYIVINLSNMMWFMSGGAPGILNTLVHELYHIGFSRHRPPATEVMPDSPELYDALCPLQEEGMATYAAYLARPLFPSNDPDYLKIEDPAEVEKARMRLNILLRQAETLPATEFRDHLFDVGVKERVLYVAGAHMARTIDELSGRKALLETISDDPRSFVRAYNSIVDGRLAIHEFALPERLSAFQRLHQAAVEGDDNELERLLEEIRITPALRDDPPQHVLNSTGYQLLYRKTTGLAEEVFRLYAELVPESENPWMGLIEIHRERGDDALLAESCRRLLELDPHHIVALEALERIRRDHSGLSLPPANPDHPSPSPNAPQ